MSWPRETEMTSAADLVGDDACPQHAALGKAADGDGEHVGAVVLGVAHPVAVHHIRVAEQSMSLTPC